MTVLRFHIPLIEPDMRDFPHPALGQDTHAFAHGGSRVKCRQSTSPRSRRRVLGPGSACTHRSLTLCLWHSHRRSRRIGVAIDRPIGFADRAEAKVIGPTPQHPIESLHDHDAASSRQRAAHPSARASSRSCAGCSSSKDGYPDRRGPSSASSTARRCIPGSRTVLRHAAHLGLLLVHRQLDPRHHGPHRCEGLVAAEPLQQITRSSA